MEKQYTLLTTVFGDLEAEILKGMLEANEIPVYLSGESAGRAIGLGVGPLAAVDIMVLEENLSDAQQMLDEYHSGEDH